jgi:hypothetical protein
MGLHKMLGFLKHKSRLYRLLDYIANRKARLIISDLRKSHKLEIEEINRGTIATINSFKKQHDLYKKTIEKNHERALHSLQFESEKKTQAIEHEAAQVRDEMKHTIDLMSKTLNRLAASEQIYERGFSGITLALQKMAPQIIAAVQEISIAEKDIEAIHKDVQSEIRLLKGSTTYMDRLLKNKLKVKG